jgi:hypothetical protein
MTASIPNQHGDIPSEIRRWAAGFASDDPPATIAVLYTAAAIYEDAPSGQASKPGEVDAFLREFLTQVEILDFRLRSGYRTKDHGTAEWVAAFRYIGQLPGLPAGTGQSVNWHGVTVFTFDGDLIAHSIDYYDNVPFLTALGLLTIQAAP